MIRLNIRTHDKIEVKSFKDKDALVDYVRQNFVMIVGSDVMGFVNEANDLANKIWETNVGQSLKTPLGHVVAIAGKSRVGNHFKL